MSEDKKIINKKREEVLVAQQIGFSIMLAVSMMFQRWKEKGWKEEKVRQFTITIEIEEAKPKKRGKKNNNKIGLYS